MNLDNMKNRTQTVKAPGATPWQERPDPGTLDDLIEPRA